MYLADACSLSAHEGPEAKRVRGGPRWLCWRVNNDTLFRRSQNDVICDVLVNAAYHSYIGLKYRTSNANNLRGPLKLS